MIKILIVDDEKGVTDTLKDFFREKGFTSMGAYSGEKALRVIKTSSPDIIVLDVKMEGMCGLEVLAKTKKYDSSIKVIMLSAMEDKEIVHNAFDLGAEEYLFKPFRLEVLGDVVRDKAVQITGGRSDEKASRTGR